MPGARGLTSDTALPLIITKCIAPIVLDCAGCSSVAEANEVALGVGGALATHLRKQYEAWHSSKTGTDACTELLRNAGEAMESIAASFPQVSASTQVELMAFYQCFILHFTSRKDKLLWRLFWMDASTWQQVMASTAAMTKHIVKQMAATRRLPRDTWVKLSAVIAWHMRLFLAGEGAPDSADGHGSASMLDRVHDELLPPGLSARHALQAAATTVGLRSRNCDSTHTWRPSAACSPAAADTYKHIPLKYGEDNAFSREFTMPVPVAMSGNAAAIDPERQFAKLEFADAIVQPAAGFFDPKRNVSTAKGATAAGASAVAAGDGGTTAGAPATAAGDGGTGTGTDGSGDCLALMRPEMRAATRFGQGLTWQDFSALQGELEERQQQRGAQLREGRCHGKAACGSETWLATHALPFLSVADADEAVDDVTMGNMLQVFHDSAAAVDVGRLQDWVQAGGTSGSAANGSVHTASVGTLHLDDEALDCPPHVQQLVAALRAGKRGAMGGVLRSLEAELACYGLDQGKVLECLRKHVREGADATVAALWCDAVADTELKKFAWRDWQSSDVHPSVEHQEMALVLHTLTASREGWASTRLQEVAADVLEREGIDEEVDFHATSTAFHEALFKALCTDVAFDELAVCLGEIALEDASLLLTELPVFNETADVALGAAVAATMACTLVDRAFLHLLELLGCGTRLWRTLACFRKDDSLKHKDVSGEPDFVKWLEEHARGLAFKCGFAEATDGSAGCNADVVAALESLPLPYAGQTEQFHERILQANAAAAGFTGWAAPTTVVLEPSLLPGFELRRGQRRSSPEAELLADSLVWEAKLKDVHRQARAEAEVAMQELARAGKRGKPFEALVEEAVVKRVPKNMMSSFRLQIYAHPRIAEVTGMQKPLWAFDFQLIAANSGLESGFRSALYWQTATPLVYRDEWTERELDAMGMMIPPSYVDDRFTGPLHFRPHLPVLGHYQPGQNILVGDFMSLASRYVLEMDSAAEVASSEFMNQAALKGIYSPWVPNMVALPEGFLHSYLDEGLVADDSVPLVIQNVQQNVYLPYAARFTRPEHRFIVRPDSLSAAEEVVGRVAAAHGLQETRLGRLAQTMRRRLERGEAPYKLSGLFPWKRRVQEQQWEKHRAGPALTQRREPVVLCCEGSWQRPEAGPDVPKLDDDEMDWEGGVVATPHILQTPPNDCVAWNSFSNEEWRVLVLLRCLEFMEAEWAANLSLRDWDTEVFPLERGGLAGIWGRRSLSLATLRTLPQELTELPVAKVNGRSYVPTWWPEGRPYDLTALSQTLVHPPGWPEGGDVAMLLEAMHTFEVKHLVKCAYERRVIDERGTRDRASIWESVTPAVNPAWLYTPPLTDAAVLNLAQHLDGADDALQGGAAAGDGEGDGLDDDGAAGAVGVLCGNAGEDTRACDLGREAELEAMRVIVFRMLFRGAWSLFSRGGKLCLGFEFWRFASPARFALFSKLCKHNSADLTSWDVPEAWMAWMFEDFYDGPEADFEPPDAQEEAARAKLALGWEVQPHVSQAHKVPPAAPWQVSKKAVHVEPQPLQPTRDKAPCLTPVWPARRALCLPPGSATWPIRSKVGLVANALAGEDELGLHGRLCHARVALHARGEGVAPDADLAAGIAADDTDHVPAEILLRLEPLPGEGAGHKRDRQERAGKHGKKQNVRLPGAAKARKQSDAPKERKPRAGSAAAGLPRPKVWAEADRTPHVAGLRWEGGITPSGPWDLGCLAVCHVETLRDYSRRTRVDPPPRSPAASDGSLSPRAAMRARFRSLREYLEEREAEAAAAAAAMGDGPADAAVPDTDAPPEADPLELPASLLDSDEDCDRGDGDGGCVEQGGDAAAGAEPLQLPACKGTSRPGPGADNDAMAGSDGLSEAETDGSDGAEQRGGPSRPAVGAASKENGSADRDRQGGGESYDEELVESEEDLDPIELMRRERMARNSKQLGAVRLALAELQEPAAAARAQAAVHRQVLKRQRQEAIAAGSTRKSSRATKRPCYAEPTLLEGLRGAATDGGRSRKSRSKGSRGQRQSQQGAAGNGGGGGGQVGGANARRVPLTFESRPGNPAEASEAALAAAEEKVQELAAAGAFAGAKVMSVSQVDGGFWLQLPRDFAFSVLDHLRRVNVLVPGKNTDNACKQCMRSTVRRGDLEERFRDRALWADDAEPIVLLPRWNNKKASGGTMPTSAGLSGGWRGFSIRQRLQEDDVVVFEYKPTKGAPRGPLDLAVWIYRAREHLAEQPANPYQAVTPDNLARIANPDFDAAVAPLLSDVR